MRTRHEPFEVHDDGCQCGECEETSTASWWNVVAGIIIVYGVVGTVVGLLWKLTQPH